MKKTITLVCVLLAVLTGCRNERRIDSFVRQRPAQADNSTQQTSRHAQDEADTQKKEKGVPNLLMQRVAAGVPDKLIERKGYTTSYNKSTRTPNWVAWTLTKQHTYGSLQRMNERFEEDFAVQTPRATFQDYYNSRYDRGHMCPAGDNKWDQKAMTESFLMTNICPQNHGLNKDDWNDLEMQCRSWARRYGEVTVVCGPLFDDDAAPRTIGKNKVRVPDGFFKVVYCSRPAPRALGFLFRNHGKGQPWRQQVCTVDEVEERSGINFFTQLDDKIENAVEAAANLKEW